MYCDIIDDKIVNPSNICGAREFDIDYTYYISCAEGYLVYDKNQDKIVFQPVQNPLSIQDKIVANPNFQKEEKQKNIVQQIKNYENKLEELDKKRIRAICEPSIKDEETQETWLDFYNSQVVEIREKILNLKTELQ